MDGLDDDEKGIATVYTPGGTQQITVQHVRDEWRGVGSVPTPGVTTWVTTDVIPPPPACNFAPGYPRSIFSPATRAGFSGRPVPNFRASTTSILRALTGSVFSPGTFDPRSILGPGTGDGTAKVGREILHSSPPQGG